MELIVTQGQLQKSRAGALAKDKKNKTKMIVEKGIIATMFMVVIIGLSILNNNLQKEAYNNCINNGYSEAYCLKNS